MAALDSTAGVEVVYVAALSPPASQASQLVENTLETPGLELCGEEGLGKGVNLTLDIIKYFSNILLTVHLIGFFSVNIWL